ncbi:MAG: DUF1839 family protein [Gemmataceae bacterium]
MKHALDLDPATYVRHAIHREDRVWPETNCYTDIWIEFLHASGHDPLAALPFTLAIDFEGDQWTFFKPHLGDLLELYGIDVQELAIWKPLARHIEEQVSRGHPVIVELDSFHLPDTAGTAYRLEHVKSSVLAVAIDVPGQRLRYFHNQGYYELSGDDFVNALRLHQDDPAFLPPYVELVKPRGGALSGPDLRAASIGLLRGHLRRMPQDNPFTAFRARFEADLPELVALGLEHFHRYSFATLRQFGACFELAGDYLRWLGGLEGPAGEMAKIATGAKSLQFQLARAVTRKKPLDLSPLDAMAQAWESSKKTLKAAYL